MHETRRIAGQLSGLPPPPALDTEHRHGNIVWIRLDEQWKAGSADEFARTRTLAVTLVTASMLNQLS